MDWHGVFSIFQPNFVYSQKSNYTPVYHLEQIAIYVWRLEK